MKKLLAPEVRESFLKFFEASGHRRLASSSLIPADDPTLLFTNAGMNQFKDVFTGREKRNYSRATTSQKCVRAGGKHNDLENVGFTARHHTFFEMLGNFSFGDYFKKEAIDFAWDLLVNRWEMPVERLWFTVYEDDDEALELWRAAGAPVDRILRFGEKDNFWAMGDTGPCGPCSEIHFYRPADLSGNLPGLVNGPGDTTIEIWNLVFMQFERSLDGTKAPLPRPSVDTGAGLERVASVLQGVDSNYDTDLFVPILRRIGEISGAVYGADSQTSAAMRVVADHARAATFLVADGVSPSNEGRGYVLRRIVRRALRYGRKLGLGDGGEVFLPKVVEAVCESLGGIYPEIVKERRGVEEILRQEETSFARTLVRAFDAAVTATGDSVARGEKSLDGKTAFDLYQTFGAPLDLLEEIARERGIEVDQAGFDLALREERIRAKASWKGDESVDAKLFQEVASEIGEVRFAGYDSLEAKGEAVVALYSSGQRVKVLRAGEKGELVVRATPFYPEGGGQVGDAGWFNGSESDGEIRDTSKPLPGLIVHHVLVGRGSVREGEKVDLLVDGPRRSATTRNHTATHLLHAALREILGSTVRQAGSLVAPDRLRFDYSHGEALSPAVIARIETLVNEKILENSAVTKNVMGMEEARKTGALMFFGEKYGENVRVVSVPGFSTELCGGCHVRATGDIGLVKIVSDRALAAGVRRMEALTGGGALELFQKEDSLIQGLSRDLGAAPDELPKAVSSARERIRELEKEIATLKVRAAAGGGGGLGALDIVEMRGIRVHVRRVENISGGDLRNLADTLRGKIGSGIIVLGSTGEDGKVTLLAAGTDDAISKVPMNKLIQGICPIVGGKGGGKADLAQGGGSDPSKLDEALAAVKGVVESLAGG